MKKILLGMLLLLSCGVATAQEADKTPPVIVTPQLDRTAIWVGDDFHYTIRAVREPNVEMVLDNFTKERLPLAPFVIRDIDIRHKDWADGKGAVEITLTLTTYETGKTDVSIPLVPLYYFVREPGQSEKERPVDSVAAPAMPIGLRSALVTESLIPRTTTPQSSPGLAQALLPFALGLGGLFSLGAYGGLRTWQRWHPAKAMAGLSREEREKIVRESLSRLQADVPAAGDDPRKWSGVMAAALRQVAAAHFQIPALSQTAEEIETALARAGAAASLGAQMKTVLSQCDALRYGRDAGGGPRLRAQLMQAAEQVIRSPHWISA